MKPAYFFGFLVAALAAAGAIAWGIVATSADSVPLLGGPAAAATSSAELTDTLAWIIAGGYAVIFIGMVVEGPMVTTAAAFAASLGYFNIFIVMAFAAAADLIADTALYLFGRASRTSAIEKHGRKVGFSQERLDHLEKLLHAHPRKTILLLKMLPGAAVVGLPLVGAARVPLKMFIVTSLSFIIPSTILFGTMGYYFGEAYETIASYRSYAEYFLAGGVVVIALVYYVYKKATAAVAHKLESEK
jgi:membrane protein DedA with SNARE-associated domain